MSSKINYLSTAYTSSGYVSFYDHLIKKAERIYILSGAAGTGKSTFLKKTGEKLLDNGFSIDFAHSCEYGSKIDAVFVNDFNILLINGSDPNFIKARYPGAIERILDFSNYCDIDYLRKEKNSIVYLVDEINREYEKLVQFMRDAKTIHDKWEKEYLLGMNFTMANEITDSLIRELVREKRDVIGNEVHRFAGALTAEGQVSFYDNLTEGIQRRIIVKGRPGTGKSTMNRKIARAAIDAGFDTEFYHCGFDADSIDMIIVRGLGFAILDGTAPHVVDPEGNDMLVDMFSCIDTEIVNEDENPIVGITEEYSIQIGKANEAFHVIGKLNEELENYYREATDFNEVDALRNRIIDTIIAMKE